MAKKGNADVISRVLNRVRDYADNYCTREEINTIEIVFCQNCRHAERTDSRVWPIYCTRLHRSRHISDFCRVVDKQFGAKKGYVFWEAR